MGWMLEDNWIIVVVGVLLGAATYAFLWATHYILLNYVVKCATTEGQQISDAESTFMLIANVLVGFSIGFVFGAADTTMPIQRTVTRLTQARNNAVARIENPANPANTAWRTQ